MKRIISTVILLTFLLAIPAQAFALDTTFRDQMIAIAGHYTQVPWSLGKSKKGTVPFLLDWGINGC